MSNLESDQLISFKFVGSSVNSVICTQVHTFIDVVIKKGWGTSPVKP